jgi:hypothetical protein
MNKGVLINYMLNLFQIYKPIDKLFYVKMKEQISTLKWLLVIMN